MPFAQRTLQSHPGAPAQPPTRQGRPSLPSHFLVLFALGLLPWVTFTFLWFKLKQLLCCEATRDVHLVPLPHFVLVCGDCFLKVTFVL